MRVTSPKAPFSMRVIESTTKRGRSVVGMLVHEDCIFSRCLKVDSVPEDTIRPSLLVLVLDTRDTSDFLMSASFTRPVRGEIRSGLGTMAQQPEARRAAPTTPRTHAGCQLVRIIMPIQL